MAGPNDTTTALRKLQRRDPSEFAALMAATGAASALEPRMLGADTAFHWPALFEMSDPPDAEDVLNAVHDKLAPFVRANPFAPPEALFRHAAGRGVHAAEPDTWSAIGLPAQAAYTVFMDTLGAVDKLRDEAQARAPRKAGPATPDDGRIPIEDSILVAGGSATDRASFAEERKVTITPGTGDVPGRQTLPRPAVPGTPIGPENTTSKPPFFPPAASDDRSGHGAEGPAAPTVPQPGGTPDLGHGFDPTAPFNETGAPPEGQAPAPAEATIGASTAVAAAPVEPRPAPDAPADLPEEEQHNVDGPDLGKPPTVHPADTGQAARMGAALEVAPDVPRDGDAARMNGDAQEADGAGAPAGRDAPVRRENGPGRVSGTRPDGPDLDAVGGEDGPRQSEAAARMGEAQAPGTGEEPDPAAGQRGPVLTGTQDAERAPGTVAETEDEDAAERQTEAGPQLRKAKDAAKDQGK